MAERRTERAPVAPPPTAPAGPASGDRRAKAARGNASAAPAVGDEPAGRRTAGGQPAGPLPETAARFAAAMAAVEQQQARGVDRPMQRASSGPTGTSMGTVSDQRAAASTASGVRRPRRARLRLTHIDPWSVLKTSLLLSIALGIVMVVAVAVTWSVLNASGLWDSINRTVGEVVGTEASAEFRIEEYVGTERVLGFTMLVAALDVVLITVVATLGAFLYNLAAALLGGLEVVLAEDEF